MGDEVDRGSLDSENLKRAMKAFKKRLKLVRLDDESGLGHGSKSQGYGEGIVAVRPPEQYHQAVWDKLVEQGKLRRTGDGLYELPPTH
jgi:hypothetical protein